ncbi:nucleoporin subcomplex protein binding to Pom34-domain-containing protein [Paraphoma chrysanthemicola]|uniref:Nucleoporin subcomplex protein binding to Pom34-domain-containing protein n=1 Tax=Paraphoma chrysanthemicola TaxID=798071 RepID=A0A8K0RDF5_9PLEO|nr:nucleoporin subcomplex protein binding to Pom34-domain-containing protein [Paraphoma chrysanthemicola]
MASHQSPELDLSKCFKGEQQLVTWDIAYHALCDPETASKSEPLRAFLTSGENTQILSSPWKPFPDPSPQEKSKFDAKTAPISVTPSPNGHYNLNEIKEDALWLSKEAQISEYAALQVVAQEWQSRPTIQLLSGLTEEEALSVQEAAGVANLGASTFMPNSSILSSPQTARVTNFDTQDQRRLRIIEIYYSTCASIIRISQLLVSWGSVSQLRNQTIYGNDYHSAGAGWIEELGQAVAAAQSGKAAASTGAKALDECLQAAQKRCAALENGYGWSVSDAIIEQASEKWVVAQTTELLHLFHLALAHSDVIIKGFLPATTIEDWLKFFLQNGFFRDFSTVTPRQDPIIPVIQLLTSLICLSILRVDLVINDLESGNFRTWERSTYVLNTAVVTDITTLFGEAKHLGPSPATPPLFAWAILTWKLTSRASYEEQERERLLEAPNASYESVPKPSALEDPALAVTRLDTHELFENIPPYQYLAEAGSKDGVLAIVTQLVETALPAFGTYVDQVSRDRIRLLFLQLIRAAVGSDIAGYSPELIVTTYSILAGDRAFRPWIDDKSSRQVDPVVSYFLEDEYVLRPLLLDEARLRFPYESTPFLKFCSALTRGDNAIQNSVPTFLDKLTSSTQLMQRLPDGFRGYALTREEENANWVELTAPLPLFTTGSTSSFRGQRRLLTSAGSSQSDGLLEIPAGTEGIIVDDSNPPYVAVWNFQHSTLTYLVQVLSTYPVGSNKVEVTTQAPAARENVLDIIGLLADLMHSSLQSADGVCAPELLEAIGISATGGQDTVSITLAIFEEELLRLREEPSNEASLELLVNCTHFLEALAVIAPQRVWPWLARSRLLEGDGNGGSLAAVLSSTEMILGRYDFLIGCIRLYKALVTDAVERSVARRTPSRALSRFNATTPSESGTSDKVMSTTLFTFGRTLASVYESSLSWKYTSAEHRPEINIAICDVFTAILQYAYGVDDAPQLSAKLTKVIAPIAEYITQLYLTKSDSNMPTNPILASLVIGVGPEDNTLLTSLASLWRRQTQATLTLADALVRVAILLNRPWTHLEQQLFKATPLLARLYGSSDKWKSQVVLLLETLVRGAVRVASSESPDMRVNGAPGTGQQEPPSLLGHLGPRTAKNFLSVLSQLDEPVRVLDIQTNVWNLLSAVVTCKQQWFSLYLLTGSTPRESMRSKSDSAPLSRNKALLTRALDAITNLSLPERSTNQLPWPLYTAMLEFISSAQNNWSWAMGDLRKQKDFIQKLLSFLNWMAKQPKTLKTDAELLDRSYQNRFAAFACEIIAMYLHSARQVGDVTVLKEVVPSLTYLEDNALELPAYSVSLHGNLKQHVEKHFPGVTLANLKRTTLYPESFGRTFFYDLDLADRLLGFDTQWSGPREGTGFAVDVEKANYNLGLVESQVQLLQSWKLLALELSHVAGKDERVARILTSVVNKSMKANADSNLPEALFGQLMVLRADLAFALLKKLVEAKVQTTETRQLLTPVWDAIRTSVPDFDSIFSNEAVDYYRSLLRILYLALNFHLVGDSDQSADVAFRSSFRGTVPTSHNDWTEAISTQLLEILSDTVARGFRSLATQLHAEPASVSPSDFALLTALLQRIIAIPEMTMWQSQAALLFANNNTIRYATSLFSWSDRLTLPNNGVDDPIYGELSLLFLLSLSSIQALAETMAVDGVLSQLNTANLMNYYRRPNGMGPFDSPARLYSIWVKGILPLCLNLLLSVGPPIAAEIASFLNQFPEQLLRSSTSINSSPSSRTRNAKLTLSIASETHSLALLSAIIDNVRKQGPKLGIQANDVAPLDWDKENVKEDVESWLSRKGALRERIVAMDEREVDMLGRKGREEGTNELEARVLGELEDAGRCLGLSI